jgi:predicted nucleotidyltransferase component of viral defense system
MLTQKEVQMFANQVGVKNLGFCEIEVILTHMLELIGELGLTQKLAFKGGTVLRKMFFGVNGRISTDLDFTSADDTAPQDLFSELQAAFAYPYRGLTLSFPRPEKSQYINADSLSVNPLVIHDWNPQGVEIKVQVSVREKPTLPVVSMPHLDQPYFRNLDFAPAAVPCLVAEEILAEKIRASQQRAKIRDLYDLAEFANRPLKKELIRRLAVIKVWQSHNGKGFSHADFLEKIAVKDQYDVGDLHQLIRKNKRPDLNVMIAKVADAYRFLGQLTLEEEELAADIRGEKKDLHTKLAESCRAA